MPELKTYLGIDRERGLPILRRDDSTNSIFLPFWRDFPNILDGVLELVLGGAEGRSFLQAVRAESLGRFSRGIVLSSALDGGQVEGIGSSDAQRHIVRMGRMGAG